MKKYFLVLFGCIICLSCSTSSFKEYDSTKDFNTTITIHYNNESDKEYTPFQQYDFYSLKDNGIVEPPAHTIESEKLKTIIRLNLDKPLLLLLGFTEYYIEPNNNLDINYSIIKQTKTEFKDSIKINQGIGIITIRNGETPFLNTSFLNTLKSNISKAKIDKVVNKETLTTEAIKSIKKLASVYPYLKKSDSIRDFLEQYYIQKEFVQLILQFKTALPRMSNDVKQYAIYQLEDLTETLSKDQKVKTRSYWFGMNKFYEQILDDEFKKTLYSYKAINEMISNYDSITQQFFLLLSVKNNYHLVEDKNAGMSQLIEHISFNEFKPYLEKYKRRNSSSGYINEDIGNCMLYDYNMKQINFSELLQKSSQPYIYFDFCGSWCKPCIEEIKEYSISKKFDNSTTIKPIWLFFENNKKDWFKVIDKYNLKKENCFLLENDSTIQKNFGILFSWQGEFPHHFVFTNKGKIINTNAEPLAFFDDTHLVK